MLNDDRLLPADPEVRRVARRLYDHVRELPIVSPHGHCDPELFALNSPIEDPAFELVTKDHYVLRMLYSQGAPLEALGVRRTDGVAVEADGRKVWQILSDNYHLFRATPSRLWLDTTLQEVFGIKARLGPGTADAIYDQVRASLQTDEFRPRRLIERFGIEFLATTDGALDPLVSHDRTRSSGWSGRIVPTFRPDDTVDPECPNFGADLAALGDMTGQDTTTWTGYLNALRARRQYFISRGATATDHGHPSAFTADLPEHEAAELFRRVATGELGPGDAELFRGQMLVEMAAMSLEDGLVMQLHPGSWRRHNPWVTERFGSDKGADIPRPMDYVGGLKALLDRFGNERSLTFVVYTLDESTYSRELAPLAGHYPALRLGPPWWFYDSPEGIRRYRQLTTETAGFANTVGFNDDARSLLTIPARHDVARRTDAGYLAGLVTEHRLEEDEAFEVAEDLAYRLARSAFRVPA